MFDNLNSKLVTTLYTDYSSYLFGGQGNSKRHYNYIVNMNSCTL